jgi:Ca2+-transporting ATPase
MTAVSAELERNSSVSDEAVNWHSLTIDEVAGQLRANLQDGLSPEEVSSRRQAYGPNELDLQEKRTWFVVLLRQFWDVLILILLIAAAISLRVGETVDAAAIFAIVIFNGLLGFVQEWRAERAIAALRQLLRPHCRVIRGGSETDVPASELVPGDLVVIDVGDQVPADLRLVTADNLKVDESTLTGESEPVEKQTTAVGAELILAERRCMAWMGTVTTGGHAKGIVVATGRLTEFGRIAKLTRSITSDVTPLQRKLAVLGKQLGVVAILISLLIGIVGVASGKPILEMFLTGVSLAVAVVPEGLPAVVTLTMALGIRAMVRRRALLRRLQAAEGLGAATVICTDKTGTLTQNQMTIREIWLADGAVRVTGVGYRPEGQFLDEYHDGPVDLTSRPDVRLLLETGVRCNHARLNYTDQGWQELGEPTEAALLVAAQKANVTLSEERNVLGEFAFDANRKRMTRIESHDGQRVAHVKGAGELIEPRCTLIATRQGQRPLTHEDRQRLHAAADQMAGSGLRTLALARRVLPADWTPESSDWTADRIEAELILLGLVGMMDPPREEVPAAIQTAFDAGIRVLMITGDSAATARAVAGQIGLPAERVLTGYDVESLSPDELRVALHDEVVFARTTPEHKLQIVKALQADGHVVGMTGDGVNDAPALKQADIGIAMGKRGTDVAKGASDIVLTDDNFSSIVGAIEEGRRQYDNIQKFVRYLLSSNTGEVIAIFLNILLQSPLILLPVQILWMNLITDSMTAVALGLEPAEHGLMRRPPRPPKSRILDLRGMLTILLIGSYMGIVTLGLFQWTLRRGGDEVLATAQTMAFCGLIFLEKFNVLNFRGLHAPMRRIGLFSNPWVLLALAAMLGLQIVSVYLPPLQRVLHTVPLAWQDWLVILGVSLPVFLVVEAYKLIQDARGQRAAANN